MPEKFMIDKSGNKIIAGDTVMYITVHGSSPAVHYGTVVKIYTFRHPYCLEDDPGQIHVHVKKFFDGNWKGYMDKPRAVTLSYPTMFKCGETLTAPTDIKVPGQ